MKLCLFASVRFEILYSAVPPTTFYLFSFVDDFRTSPLVALSLVYFSKLCPGLQLILPRQKKSDSKLAFDGFVPSYDSNQAVSTWKYLTADELCLTCLTLDELYST